MAKNISETADRKIMYKNSKSQTNIRYESRNKKSLNSNNDEPPIE